VRIRTDGTQDYIIDKIELVALDGTGGDPDGELLIDIGGN